MNIKLEEIPGDPGAKLKSYTHDDSELEAYDETLQPYVGGYRARNVPFWVFIDDEKVVGIVVVDEEPVRLIEPIGTTVSVLLFTDYDLPSETLNEFASEALNLAKKKEAAYSFIELSSERKGLIEHFQSIGYKSMGYSILMIRDLDEDFNYDERLRFEKIGRDEVNNFLLRIKEFMSGSPDDILNIVLDNMGEMPDAFLDHWYEREHLYYVYSKKEIVGLLDLSPQYLNVANIGVSPEYRRRGYGRQMMLFALKTLKDQGREHSALRVHAENTNALKLYQSLGFSKDQERIALIWRE